MKDAKAKLNFFSECVYKCKHQAEQFDVRNSRVERIWIQNCRPFLQIYILCIVHRNLYFRG